MAAGSGEAVGWTPSWSPAYPDEDVTTTPGAWPAGPVAWHNGTELPEDPVLYAIQLWFTPMLVTLGTLGNCLCVIVFFGTKLNKLSSSYYLSGLAISDTCCLVAVAATWLEFIDIPVFNKNGSCQLFVYLKSVCSFLSVWFVVAFTVERFVAVSYPLQRLSMCTVARARAILASLTVAGLGLYSPYLFISAVIPVPAVQGGQGAAGGAAANNGTVLVCDMLKQWHSLARVLNYADICLTLVLPVLLILSLNACIARTVLRLARARKDLTNTAINGSGSLRGRRAPRRTLQHRGSTRPGGTQSKVTEMLLIVSTVFIALNLPSYIVRLYIFVNETTHQDEGSHTIVILQHYFNVLFDANFGINFVLYCVSGQNFRRALFGMCGLRTRRTDATMLTVVSEVGRTGSLNRHRTNNVSSFRYIRDVRGSQELLAKDHREGNGYHADIEKTHL
ncbi:CNMa Receptor 1 [Frankliniella occidentalis]|uniref:Thyrotropin-releasing hormone receptor-like n=1 Tax=Frankliniella occidentalis TaxID=133901 RepID=A0A6J1TTE1_FRAOC|nr:thyrotropin-releasing hormone receptor-like [Frankliniella occidentalis]XP_026293912.1 thyrotropin-releasing hormone receptor-like [Frankliniella occidentalis]XP_052121881.1 thyrotropin-releasing hormone receptor-like [Frankliniella occidentalis]KAE8748601.1 CNMa Receptor 1 [Frankliniella occidentalis]